MRGTNHTFLLVGGHHTHRLLRTEAQMWTERVKLQQQKAGTLEGQKYTSQTKPLLVHCRFLYSEAVSLLPVRDEERRLLPGTSSADKNDRAVVL